MSLRHRIAGRYQGAYLPPDNPPGSPLIFVMGHYKRHCTSRVVHTVFDFYLREWKWLLPFVVAFLGTVAAVVKL